MTAFTIRKTIRESKFGINIRFDVVIDEESPPDRATVVLAQRKNLESHVQTSYREVQNIWKVIQAKNSIIPTEQVFISALDFLVSEIGVAPFWKINLQQHFEFDRWSDLADFMEQAINAGVNQIDQASFFITPQTRVSLESKLDQRLSDLAVEKARRFALFSQMALKECQLNPSVNVSGSGGGFGSGGLGGHSQDVKLTPIAEVIVPLSKLVMAETPSSGSVQLFSEIKPSPIVIRRVASYSCRFI